MPPDLDVYVLSKRRDQTTIDRFLDKYIDRPASEDRTGEELMVLPLNASADGDSLDAAKWEWVPVTSLADIMAYGLARPSRAFACSLRPRDVTFTHAYVVFTSDDQLIVGLSLDDEGMRPTVQSEAERVMHRLMEEFDGHRGLIGVEWAPPLSETSFAAADGPLITAKVVRWPGESSAPPV